MLRIITDSLISMLAYGILIIHVIRIVYNISNISKYKYFLAYIGAFIIDFLFKYFRNYKPKMNFLEYIGCQTIACFLIYIVFELLYCLLKKVRKTS